MVDEILNMPAVLQWMLFGIVLAFIANGLAFRSNARLAREIAAKKKARDDLDTN